MTDPTIVETSLGRFAVCAGHDAKRHPPALFERPTLNRPGFKPDEKMHQHSEQYVRAIGHRHEPKNELQGGDDRDVDHEREPLAFHQEPERAEDKSPEMEAIAHEDE